MYERNTAIMIDSVAHTYAGLEYGFYISCSLNAMTINTGRLTRIDGTKSFIN